MRWFRRAKESPRREGKVLILGLDGVPYTLLTSWIQAGALPNLARLVEAGSIVPMSSVLPPISSVAWASFATGRDPGGHGIFGFVDRRPNPFELYLPTSADLQGDTLWEVFGRHGRRSLVMNLPSTYPPKPMQGMLVSGFESPSLEKATYPPELGSQLKSAGYIVDVEPWRPGEPRERLLADLEKALDTRVRCFLDLLGREAWDLAIVQIMETDRLHHFLWNLWEDEDETYAPRFAAFYRLVDEAVGQIVARSDGYELVMLSDHGFCRVDREVSLNRWLRREGWLSLPPGDPPELARMLPESRAYSLIPGRIYVNLRGREARGSVEPGREYEEVCFRLARALLSLEDEDGTRPIARVFRREEVYRGELAARKSVV